MNAVRTRRTIDIDGANAVLDAAEAKARGTGARVFIAVADPNGELVALRRTAGAQVASARVSVDKARTAAIFVRPSRELEEQVSSGRIGARLVSLGAEPVGDSPKQFAARIRREHDQNGKIVKTVGVRIE